MGSPNVVVLTQTTRLSAEFDLEARIRPARAGDAVKGMFFSRYIQVLTSAGLDWSAAGLQQAPASGRFLPFSDYALADYFRLARAVGRALHPTATVSEQLRRAAGADFELFTQSKVGRVMMAFASDPVSVLAKCGAMYRTVVAGPVVESERRGPDRAVVRFREYRGPVECYPAGTLEGVCRTFGVPYEMRIEQLGPTEANYEITVLDRPKT